jgi:hypothetical protein
LGEGILDGQEVGEDLGYGPTRIASVALCLFSEPCLMLRYEGQASDVAEIYPGGFADDDSWWKELKQDFGLLKRLYMRAA